MAAKVFAASQYVVSATLEVDGKYIKKYVRDSNTINGDFSLVDKREDAEVFNSYGAGQITIMSIWKKRNSNSINYLFGIEQEGQ